MLIFRVVVDFYGKCRQICPYMDLMGLETSVFFPRCLVGCERPKSELHMKGIITMEVQSGVEGII